MPSVARELAERCRVLRETTQDEADAERRAFQELIEAGTVAPDSWSEVYQEFLGMFAPGLRRERGVYYTPTAVVQAQVRLTADVLQERLGYADDFGDERVFIVDPAAGSGAYPLGVVEHLGGRVVASSLVSRMRLFEALPGAASIARARGLPVEERDALSSTQPLDAPVVVCLGNPPYRRVPGMAKAKTPSNLDGFVTGTQGIHRKNLYNEYVYFWRWALRMVFEQRPGPGIVCFVTAASYLRGPAFVGLRQMLRRLLDELWIVDLEGDHLAARRTENVFPIRTPVAIAIGVRLGAVAGQAPAVVQHARLSGSREAKLAQLGGLSRLSDLTWQLADGDSFVPATGSAYERWPKLTDLFPWQISGAQLKRTWPIGPTPEVLKKRWKRLLELSPVARACAFKPTRDRDLTSAPSDLRDPSTRLAPLQALTHDAVCLEPVRYAYRSFDRQWVLPDARLGDFMRPALWRIAGPRQIFLTSLLTNVLGRGPAAVATALVPDLDHFRGSFGARAVIPLWCDVGATRPNVDSDWLVPLADEYGDEVSAEKLLAYCYALLGTRGYVARFEEELRTPGPRVPLTRRADLFRTGVDLGQRLLSMHTYRLVPRGQARCTRPHGDEYPGRFTYDPHRQTLHLGDGSFAPIEPTVWDYSVSGLQVLRSWLRRRLPRTGTSPLDAIKPEVWTPSLTDELLELVWVLEGTLALEPLLDRLLDEVVAGDCYSPSK